MTDTARIVIVGGGYGGAYCAQALGKTLRGLDAEVLLLDRHNYFIFYPLLVEAGTGSLEPRHAVVPIREFIRRGEFRMAEVTAVDLAQRTVRYRVIGRESVDEVTYDHLVLTPGSVTLLPDVPGLHERGYEMKTLSDAVALRDRAIQMLELADATADAEVRRALLRFVVVGGNFSGVEVAGEFEEFLQSASRHYRHVQRGECSMTLIELQDRILGPLGPDLSQFALHHLRRRGIDVRLQTTVTEVHSDHVILRGGERVPTHTVIWCAGIKPPPLTAAIDGLPLDQRGYVLCERDLHVRGLTNVWAIGDAAVNPDPEGRPYPSTAQHATREGAHLAKNIAAVLKGEATTECDLRSMGMLAALGCRTGVAKVFGIKISGFPAWWLWRTVYLLKMPRWSRRVRVALDWTINLLFSRDYVQLGVHRVPAREG